MLHTKPQGHWPFGSGEEDFWRVFTIYGRGGHLGHVTQTPRTNFCFPIPSRFHMKFGFDWPSGFGEEDLWKWWTDNGRMDDGPWLYYKLTSEPKASGELIVRQCDPNWPQNKYRLTWPIFHGQVILLNTWWINIIVGVMDQCDTKIDLIKYM